MTGALVAHAFASAGIATTVLEAGTVARGSTAASSALLLQEPDLELTELTNRYGRRNSRRMWQMSRDSVHGLVTLLRRLRIACDLEQRDAIYYATDAQAVARLRAEYELRDRCGFDATWLGPGALRRTTGIPGRGAIRTHGSAQFDPVSRVSGRSARGRGCRRTGVRTVARSAHCDGTPSSPPVDARRNDRELSKW